MLEKELLSLLLQDFPESIVITLAIFALLRLKFDFKKVFIISILQTFTNLVRLLPIAFGMHTVILLITMTVYTRIFTKQKVSKILSSVILLAVIMATMQVLYIQPLLGFTNLSYEYVAATPILRAAFCLPYELVFVGLALYLNHKTKKQNSFSDLNKGV